jgi:HlyD family secretion protein
MGAETVPGNAGAADSTPLAAQKPADAAPDAAETSKKSPTWSASTWWKLSAAALVILTLVAYLMRNVVLGTPATVVAATSGELLQSVVASGRVISPQRVSVALQGTGWVVRVAVVEGQTVQKGQLLIELDNSDSLATLAQATADVAQAQARLRQLGELNHPQAAQALSQAQANAIQATKTLDRNRTLVLQGFISPAALDEAQRAVDVATSGVTSAQAMAYSSTPRGSDTALAQAALAQAVAGRQLARAKVAQGAVLAPSSGVLISREVEVGDIVQPGKALMVLAASGQTQLLVQIDEKNLSKIALGQVALGSADAYANQRFDAVVAYINPGVDATRGSVEVKLAVASPPPYLRQDMTVSVDIETARRAAAVVIATSTLEDADTDKPWVLVVRGKHAVKQFVTLGLRGDTRVEVLEGLSAGEGVIAKSKLGVKAGQRVRARVQDVPPPVREPDAGKSPVAP